MIKIDLSPLLFFSKERASEGEGASDSEKERETQSAMDRRERPREREKGRGTARAARSGYNCLTLKKMGCVRGGGGWTDGRAREQDRKGLEDVAEEAAVLREAGGRRAAGQRVVGLRTTSMERYNRVARMCRSRG